MGNLKDWIGQMVIQRMIDKVMGSGLMQAETAADGERRITEGMPAVARQAAAEGCVLLKNDGSLPLKKDHAVSVFGRCQLDWFYVGYGSGGDVSAPYYVNLMEGMDHAGAVYDQALASVYAEWCSSKEHKADHGWWGHWPLNHPEMPVNDALVKGASERTDTAVVVIGRAAGEDRESTLTAGSYYLTEEEKCLLDQVTAHFAHVIVLLNIGSVMDLSWTLSYGDKLSAILIAWMGGMESGHAVCDVLYGDVTPCGHLPDTIAVSYEDYPSSSHFGGMEYNDYAEGIYVGYRHFDKYAEDRILYPFGHGLSYTSFSLMSQSFSIEEDKIICRAAVQNTGCLPGKKVVMLWCYLPQQGLDKPVRVLAGFSKTPLLAPGEKTETELVCSRADIASYDESRHAFLLDAGDYRFCLEKEEAGVLHVAQAEILTSCREAMTKQVALKERILDELPAEIPAACAQPADFADVVSGKAEEDAFIASLSDRELEALSRGQGMMNSRYGVSGNAGAFGGIIPSLTEKGIPAVITSDGPSGLRLNKYASLLPCGTALASSWNSELVEALYHLIAVEMKEYGVDVLLAPGMNIHRNPLCGRNFEYYSEDPLLSGKTAAAAVRGIQSLGGAACPKHFCCNNQETRRNTNDSRVSERALREIYLRNFEICIKESSPLTIMTSYNKVNGIWSHYNYDLATTILRKEWKFEGAVVTDWWMQRSVSPEFPLLKDNAYRVRAQVDVLMPGDMKHMAKTYRSDETLLASLGKAGGITRGELQRTARNVLHVVKQLKFK